MNNLEQLKVNLQSSTKELQNLQERKQKMLEELGQIEYNIEKINKELKEIDYKLGWELSQQNISDSGIHTIFPEDDTY